MAPTICSEKEYHSRNRLRESIQKQSQNNASNYAGKITHRRSIAARNAKSIKFSLVNSYENDTTMYENDSMIDNNNNNQQNIRHSINLSSIKNINNKEFDENCKNINVINDNIPSSTSFSSICDRLTSNQFFNINLTENNKNLYLYQKQSKFNHRNDTIFYETSSSSSSSSQSSTSSSQLNCIPVITSTVCIGDSNDMKINKNLIQKKQCISDKKHIITTPTTNSKGLVDIALKTITLIRRNQLLQKKLLQLQVETKEFIQSVMANPENRAFCNKQLNEQSLITKNNNN